MSSSKSAIVLKQQCHFSELVTSRVTVAKWETGEDELLLVELLGFMKLPKYLTIIMSFVVVHQSLFCGSSTMQVQENRLTIEGLEKERDFYFGKLRDIEVLCQEHEDLPVIKSILDILYATEVSWFLKFCILDASSFEWSNTSRSSICKTACVMKVISVLHCRKDLHLQRVKG